MGSAKDYYEEYWTWRSDSLNYHALNLTPPRHTITLGFIKQTLARQHADRQRKVLDLACGEGMMGKLLGADPDCAQLHRIGVDISETALRLAASHYNETRQLDAESLATEFPEHTFDLIVCLEMIEHIFFPDRLLKACHKLLAPDGRLVVSTPNFAFYGNRLRVMRGEFPEEVHVFSGAEHIHYFTHESFCQLLEKSGFAVEDFDGTYATPRGFGRILGAHGTHRLFLRRPNLFGKQIVYLVRPLPSADAG